jgi:hypothetical protein
MVKACAETGSFIPNIKTEYYCYMFPNQLYYPHYQIEVYDWKHLGTHLKHHETSSVHATTQMKLSEE